MMISHVKFLGVCVSDQDRALAFYTEKLGFQLKTDMPFDGGQRWIELEIPGARTQVVLFTPKGLENRIGGFINSSLACDDLDKTYEEYRSRGVEFTAPPTKQPWGAFAMFKDPDGNTFVLSSEAKK
jgi:predicted enzyme related to lactoylglutathione lyase